MRCMKILFLLGMAGSIAGCSPILVNYDFDAEVNFDQLKTYDWLRIPPNPQVDELSLKQIRNAVNTQLEGKGFSAISENPDFWVAVHPGKQEKIAVTNLGYSYGPYRRYGGGTSGRYRTNRGVDVQQYEEGTLILDFVDSKTEKLIWRGVAATTINPYATSEERARRINKAVAEMLTYFPPPPKQ